jgi:hypothetical protein
MTNWLIVLGFMIMFGVMVYGISEIRDAPSSNKDLACLDGSIKFVGEIPNQSCVDGCLINFNYTDSQSSRCGMRLWRCVFYDTGNHTGRVDCSSGLLRVGGR